MNRQEYRAARRLIRDNGAFALRWLKGHVNRAMDRLIYGQTDDRLAARADIVRWCRNSGIAYNFRQIR